jgi:hypothetical protein
MAETALYLGKKPLVSKKQGLQWTQGAGLDMAENEKVLPLAGIEP